MSKSGIENKETDDAFSAFSRALGGGADGVSKSGIENTESDDAFSDDEREDGRDGKCVVGCPELESGDGIDREREEPEFDTDAEKDINVGVGVRVGGGFTYGRDLVEAKGRRHPFASYSSSGRIEAKRARWAD